MLQTWQQMRIADEVCSRCETVYEVVAQRLPTRIEDVFHCLECGHLMRKWTGSFAQTYSIKETRVTEAS